MNENDGEKGRGNRARDARNLITDRDLFGLTRIIKCGTFARKLAVRFISFIVYITTELPRLFRERVLWYET